MLVAYCPKNNTELLYDEIGNHLEDAESASPYKLIIVAELN